MASHRENIDYARENRIRAIIARANARSIAYSDAAEAERARLNYTPAAEAAYEDALIRAGKIYRQVVAELAGNENV